jgi:hypothetical protein
MTALLLRLQDRTQLDTSHSVGLLFKGDRLVAETSTCQHTTHKRQTSMLRRDSNPQSQHDSCSTPTPSTAHPWDRLIWPMTGPISSPLWKLQSSFNSHKLWKILLTIWRNFSFSRKITFRGVSLLFRSYFQLLIEINYWEIEWKLSVGIGLALYLN